MTAREALKKVIAIADREFNAFRETAAMKEMRDICEAALSSQPPNSAAMREALEKMCDLFERGVICTSYANTAEEMEQIEELYRKVKAALAAPLRNCDVGTAEEQDDRMTLYCQTRKCESCPLWDNVNNGVRCEFTWAQMPYEENESEAKWCLIG